MKRKPVWPWFVFAIALLSLCLSGCWLFGPPVDSNMDGKIDAREASQPAATVAKDVVAVTVPGAAPIVNWLYDLIYPAAVGGGAVFVSKKGSKKRHAAQEEKHKAQMKAIREENQNLRDLIVQLAKKQGVDVVVPKVASDPGSMV